MKKTILIIGGIAALLLSVPAYANFTSPTFSTAPGATIGGVSAGGTAQFSFNSTTGVLSITLSNTGDVVDIAHLLTGVGWNFVGGNATGLSAPSASSNNGYSCSGSGAGTVCIVDNAADKNPWKSDVATGTLGSSPFNISSFTGTPKGSALANSSIIPDGKDGLGGDSPYLASPVTFTTTVTGTNLASITGVSNVFLAFGTTGDGLTTTATPEPGFYGLLALGVSGLFFARRRSSKKVS